MRRLSITLSCVALALACVTGRYDPKLYPKGTIPPQAGARSPLKAHMHSGNLAVLDVWRETDSALVGIGIIYDRNRRFVRGAEELSLPFSDIALLEMEVRTGSRPVGVAGLAVWSVLMGAVTVACVADPKACFGSCPTFYVDADSGDALVAEGFSGSIAQALEARDLDAIGPTMQSGNRMVVTMRNEALETHAVRHVKLVAAPRPPAGRVFAGPSDNLYAAELISDPLTCRAPEGDCYTAIRTKDGVERTSLADSFDLAAREQIELSFAPARGRLGLVFAARQSLMTTFLFYETMGFLGTHAGATLASLERAGSDGARQVMGMADLVGHIDLEVWDGIDWQAIGSHEEAGPLATEVRVFPFEHQADGPIRIRLTAPKGAWRLDWIALAALGERVEPVVLDPIEIRVDGVADVPALERMLDPSRHLVTYPAESYDIVFELPRHDASWELFVESEGYYYEWMREEWLGNENPALAALTLGDPRQALRVLAPAYKRAEPRMEQRFWSSRFGR